MARVRAHGAARLLKWRAAAWTLDRKALTPRLQLFIVADMAPARSCAASLTVHQCLSRSWTRLLSLSSHFARRCQQLPKKKNPLRCSRQAAGGRAREHHWLK